MELTQILVSAITGLISGALASLVAPWVNWGIERHRIRFNSKQSLIADVRHALEACDYNKDAFCSTVEYSRIKPYLGEGAISVIESSNPILEPVMETLRAFAGNDDYFKKLILDEIARLEIKWKLI